ncbi:MAG TPA: hypothetical protein VMT57_00885 [Candidatus Thermoplasmatota archaeon]|nr:hypothetical protein [Candidatus Thermoplasmatota archaeon]
MKPTMSGTLKKWGLLVKVPSDPGKIEVGCDRHGKKADGSEISKEF